MITSKLNRVSIHTIYPIHIKALSKWCSSGVVSASLCHESVNGGCVTDGYQVYHAVENEREELRIVGCWFHARRRYDETVKTLPKTKQKDSRAYLALTMIQASYHKRDATEGSLSQRAEKPLPAERKASGGGLFRMDTREPSESTTEK